jgi:hypothetical protein
VDSPLTKTCTRHDSGEHNCKVAPTTCGQYGALVSSTLAVLEVTCQNTDLGKGKRRPNKKSRLNMQALTSAQRDLAAITIGVIDLSGELPSTA